MYTGSYEGIKVTGINGGRFSTDTSITTEVMCNAGIKNIIRIGTCGALDEDIKVGDLFILHPENWKYDERMIYYNFETGSAWGKGDAEFAGEIKRFQPELNDLIGLYASIHKNKGDLDWQKEIKKMFKSKA